MGLDIGKAFTFVTDDPKWVTKVLIGGGLIIAAVFLIITVIGWIFVAAIVGGYLIQLTRNVINGEVQPLPEWDNWGVKMTDGFKAIVIGLVYSIPVILVSLIFTVPSSIMSASGNSGAQTTGSLLGLLGGCLNFFLGIAVALVSPIALARFATTNSLSSAFQFGEVISILRQNIGTYIIVALLAAIVLQFVAGIGLIACFVGVFFTGFYAELVGFHLYGQAYRAAQGPSTSFGTPAGARPF